MGVNEELGADELSGFNGTDVKESNLFSDIDSLVSRGTETSTNVDWFGIFSSTKGEDDDGPLLKYQDSDGKRSYDGADRDQAP